MKRLLFAFPILAGALTLAASAAAPAPGPWQPAVATAVSASADNKGFTITASVKLPQPKACYNVQIAKALIMIYPPHYVVQQLHAGRICTEVLTPYIVKRHFDAKPLPKSVNVDTLDVHHKPKHWVVPIIIESK